MTMRTGRISLLFAAAFAVAAHCALGDYTPVEWIKVPDSLTPVPR